MVSTINSLNCVTTAKTRATSRTFAIRPPNHPISAYSVARTARADANSLCSSSCSKILSFIIILYQSHKHIYICAESFPFVMWNGHFVKLINCSFSSWLCKHDNVNAIAHIFVWIITSVYYFFIYKNRCLFLI